MKFDSVSRNLTAMMTYNEKMSLAMQTLTEKNKLLEVSGIVQVYDPK